MAGESFGRFRPRYFTSVRSGYNWRVSRALVGIEGEVGFLPIDEPGFGLATGVSGTVYTGEAHYKSNFRSTVVVKAGYEIASGIAPYVIGGLAVSPYHWPMMARGVSGPFAAAFGTTVWENWRLGWTAGAGVEMKLSPQWSVDVRWQMHHFSRVSRIGSAFIAGTAIFSFIGNARGRDHILTTGVNYWF